MHRFAWPTYEWEAGPDGAKRGPVYWQICWENEMPQPPGINPFDGPKEATDGEKVAAVVEIAGTLTIDEWSRVVAAMRRKVEAGA